jgi:hypothetical protein
MEKGDAPSVEVAARSWQGPLRAFVGTMQMTRRQTDEVAQGEEPEVAVELHPFIKSLQEIDH